MNRLKADFLKAVELHQGIIQSLCRIYYSNPIELQDARQEVLLQLWKSFPSFRGEAEVSTWMYRVTLNTLLSRVNKDKKRPQGEHIDAHHEKIALTSGTADDDLQLLHQVIGSLKVQDKALVALYLEGYKNKEIAKILTLSPTNVSTRLNRIKQELKSRFTDYTHELR